MKQVEVTGHFTAGGIEIYIMDDATYHNWLKWDRTRPLNILYDSGLLTMGSINQVIAVPGKYHLLLTNREADAAHQISATITLHWVY